MKFGISVPNFGDYFDARQTALLAQEAEQAGWDGFFVWDHLFWSPFPSAPVADPWVLLTVIALNTTRVKLGAMVTPVSRRRPWKLARETVTLDHLSGGRLIFGAGLGYFEKEEFENFGEVSEPRERAELLDETLDILTGLWLGEPFSYTGKHYTVEELQFLPSELQEPRIPIWVAGIWPNRKPFQRAAKWDGVAPISKADRPLTPEEVRSIREIVRENRPPSPVMPFDLSVSGWTDGGPKSNAADTVGPLRDAGATWWIESFDPWRFNYNQALDRARQGPPRLD